MVTRQTTPLLYYTGHKYGASQNMFSPYSVIAYKSKYSLAMYQCLLVYTKGTLGFAEIDIEISSEMNE